MLTSCPFNEDMVDSVGMSQYRRVVSSDPDTSFRPSREKRTERDGLQGGQNNST